MNLKSNASDKSRTAFLLALAVLVSLLFFWVIKDFVLTLFLAAILAGLLHPIYRRLLKWTGERKSLASALTVVLAIVVIVVPLLLFSGIVVSEAAAVSGSAKEWMSTRQPSADTLQEKLAANSHLKTLLPYQDQIVAKAHELAAKAGGLMAAGFATGVKGTGEFLLALFVMLYAIFYFLSDGRAILDSALRHTPLSKEDQVKLLGIFISVSRATLKGKLIIGIVQGGLAGLSFWAAGIKGVFFWGTLMALLSVIPSVGTAIVWVPAVIYLAVSGQTGAAIGVGLWCAVVVGTIDNVLTPKLIGKDTEMPDLLVLLTTLGGLAVFGIPGIIIGPVIGALFMAIWERWGSATEEDRNTTAASSPEFSTQQEN